MGVNEVCCVNQLHLRACGPELVEGLQAKQSTMLKNWTASLHKTLLAMTVLCKE